jgi:hypothetical protein
MAGPIDGEGTITLSAQHRGERRRLVISISNTDRSLLEFVRQAAGVGVVTSKRTYDARHSPSFAYKVTCRQALGLLAQVAPHLKTYRRERAALALQRYLALTPRNGKYRAEDHAKREAFECELLALGPGPRGARRA